MEMMECFEEWRNIEPESKICNNVEPRLCRALRELKGVEEACCLLELASDDPEAISGQLNHCMVRCFTIYMILRD